ncbi:MAG: uncharacterized protein KVP18_000977 [Porospora cf. gigantea A]|uniref:uncharacterized protein n=1 Tax=Porospora cf. gigantea A TaxID=2853593 RepID=UPI00355A3087|nr:MAG: hypothetical protein KVP18_000977 [Porospora cf. gigantea A]
MALEVQSLIRQKTFLLRQVAAQTTELECLRRKDYFDTQMTCQIIPKIQGLLSIYFKVRLPTALTLPDFYKQVTDF